jgi:hypothetical protein
MRTQLEICILALSAALAWGCDARPAGPPGGGVGTAAFAAGDCCTAHLECQDGLWCNGEEYCNCWGVCLSGTPINCDDGDPETSDRCVNDYIGTPGVRGTGSLPGVDGEIGTGHCENDLTGRPCVTVADCEDNDICTDQACVGNFCQYTAIVCDDGDVCTADSCDAAMGCIYNATQGCCTDNADCDDDNACTADVCDVVTNQCTYSANTGLVCDYPDGCYTPGICGIDGLCYPGSLRAPANDTCGGAIDVILSDIGEACVTGTTMCSVNDYQGSCETGMNADVTYRFQIPSRVGAPVYQNGVDYTARERPDCTIVDGTAVGCCSTNWWEYTFAFPATGGWRAGAETENYTMDLTSWDVKHRISVYLDGVFKGEIVNPATTPTRQTGSIYLGSVTAGSHVLRYQWTNDWYDDPQDSNIKIHRVWIQPDDTPSQLYAYNVMVDAEFDAALYAERACGVAATEIACSNNCVDSALLDCGFYGLSISDPAFTLLPVQVGDAAEIFFVVDGKLGERGDFQLKISRILHKNNPCAAVVDSIRRVDATAGGEFRGNIDGYINDMMDATYNWLKTPCHGPGAAGAGWPATAWFMLKPTATTTYRIWTDETTPATWFDTVITVWDNSSALGCGGPKTYIGCAHSDGRNGPDAPTVYQGTFVNGMTYLVGISNYQLPTAGNYVVHFDIM